MELFAECPFPTISSAPAHIPMMEKLRGEGWGVERSALGSLSETGHTQGFEVLAWQLVGWLV